MCWYSRSVRVIAGATVIESPVCTPIGSMFSIEQTTTTLSLRSRMSSSSNSFQPSTDCSTSTSWTGLAARPRATMVRTSRGVSGEAGAEAAHGERRPDDDLVADRGRELDGLLEGVTDQRLGGLRADRAHDLLEALAVLTALDGLDVGADQLDAVLVEHTGFVQRARPGSAPSGRRAWPAGRRGARRR